MLARVTDYTNAIEAHLARMRLEAEGVPAFVFHEHHVWAYWLMSLALGGVKVYVHVNDIARAAEIIAAHDRGDYALPDEEPTVCPRCHSRRIVSRRLSWKTAVVMANLVAVPWYFRWAELRCRSCRGRWALPDTRADSLSTIVVAGTIAVFAVFGLAWAGFCYENLDPSSIWPYTRGCK